MAKAYIYRVTHLRIHSCDIVVRPEDLLMGATNEERAIALARVKGMCDWQEELDEWQAEPIGQGPATGRKS